jgi:hypothetical protein
VFYSDGIRFESLSGNLLSRLRYFLFFLSKFTKMTAQLRSTVDRRVYLGVRHPSGTRDQFFSFS